MYIISTIFPIIGTYLLAMFYSVCSTVSPHFREQFIRLFYMDNTSFSLQLIKSLISKENNDTNRTPKPIHQNLLEQYCPSNAEPQPGRGYNTSYDNMALVLVPRRQSGPDTNNKNNFKQNGCINGSYCTLWLPRRGNNILYKDSLIYYSDC